MLDHNIHVTLNETYLLRVHAQKTRSPSRSSGLHFTSPLTGFPPAPIVNSSVDVGATVGAVKSL